MKVSFVIPAYNEEAVIGTCLAEVLREIERNKGDWLVEVIVVNNASIDKTKEIALSLPGVQVVDETRKGLVWARRAGYYASTGELIANIDADTKMPPDWLKKVKYEFERDPNLVALSGPHIFYDASLFTRFVSRFFYIVGFVFDKTSEFLFKNGSMLQGGNFIFRREAMEKIGGFDTSIEFYGEDINIGRRMHRIGTVKWTFALPIYASGRRFAKQGILKTGMIYMMNYLWETFFKKPLSKNYEDIRLKKKDEKQQL